MAFTNGQILTASQLNALEAATVPAGVISPFGGSSAPTNWLLCDGQAVSRSTYSVLFAAIGTAYGTGNGSTTFNVPNLKGRVPVGRDSAQTEFDTLGETGGAKTHTLSTAEMPSHEHRLKMRQSDIEASGYGMGLGGGFLDRVYINFSGFEDRDYLEATGSGSAHNNLQPYQVVNYIIKT